MKFTKIMALALALVMIVCAFAACGGEGDDTTKAPDTTEPSVTNPAETDPAEETEACKHTRTREIPGSRVEPTCTVDGKYTVICRACEYQWDEPIPASHTYSPLKSTDGNYTKYFCSVCQDVYVADANDVKVEDYSAIEFPFFFASFDDIALIENIADKFDGVSYVSASAANVVNFTDGEETNSYLNIPTGTSAQNANGYFSVKDDNNAFASKVFTISFAAEFLEDPLSGELNLLTWTIGGTDIVILKVDGNGKLYVAGNNNSIATFTDKGWDKVTVVVDPTNGNIDVTFDGVTADGVETVKGTGKLGTSVAGKTESVIKFFDKAGQFEANIDEVLFSVAK